MKIQIDYFAISTLLYLIKFLCEKLFEKYNGVPKGIYLSKLQALEKTIWKLQCDTYAYFMKDKESCPNTKSVSDKVLFGDALFLDNYEQIDRNNDEAWNVITDILSEMPKK